MNFDLVREMISVHCQMDAILCIVCIERLYFPIGSLGWLNATVT